MSRILVIRSPIPCGTEFIEAALAALNSRCMGSKLMLEVNSTLPGVEGSAVRLETDSSVLLESEFTARSDGDGG